MKIRADSGIEISLINSENASKIISFNKPVRLIELTDEEAARLGGSLVADRHPGITSELRKLADAGYFSVPKPLAEIREELRRRGSSVSSASLNVLLSKLAERKEIGRSGQRGSYRYHQVV